MKTLLKNENGFTLIEIIAVLIILGILAAIAVPKFLDFQQSARDRVAWNAIAAVKSQVLLDYNSAVINNPAEAQSWVTGGPASGAYISFGDFVGSYTANINGTVTVTISAGAPEWLISASGDTTQIY